MQMNVSLVLVTEEGRQQDVPLRKPVSVVGRQTDVAIRIPSSSVSRHHCEVALADHKVVLKDLGSSNGTFVNKRRITQTDLKAGDLLSIGGKVFVVRINGLPETIDPEEAFDDGFVPVANAGGAPAAPIAAAGAPAKPSPPAKAPEQKKAPLKSLAEDDDDDDLIPGKPGGKAGSGDPDDSDEFDFDFLDEDDDLKKQPKL
jgi:predicted component of type VI protein secretion system